MTDNFDSPWKRALKRNVAEFVAFFFLPYWSQIDWERPIVFRDKELNDVYREGRPRTLIADLLVSVFLHDGREILLHIEVQAQRDPKLALRIFEYNFYLFRTHGLPVASLVLLADPGRRWRQTEFYICALGTENGHQVFGSESCRLC